MPHGAGRSWLVRAVALLTGATLVAACATPTAPDLEPVALGAVAVPAPVDPARLGWESAGEALAVAPQLADRLEGCDVEVVAAARQVLGVHCADGSASGTVYSDVLTDQVFAAADLLSDAGRARVEAALGAAPTDDTSGDGLEDIRFDTAGNLVIVTDAGSAAWQIESDDAAGLLSDSGRLVRGAVRLEAPFRAAGTQAPAGSTVVAAADTKLPPPAAQPVAPPSDEVDCSTLKCIAITYDDGPGSQTDQLLDILKARGAKATFFMIGRQVGSRAATVKRMVDEGHEVGNHTWDHPNLARVGDQEVASQLTRTQDAIKAASGVAPRVMRPPYGSTSDAALQVIGSLGLAAINWNVDTEDWKNKDAAKTTERALAGARPGAIILMHDIHPSTIEAAPGIIDALQAQGYTLVTVSELIGALEPGHKYFSRP